MGGANNTRSLEYVCDESSHIIPTTTRPAPERAAYRRPMKSDVAPANGAIAATASVYTIPNHLISASVDQGFGLRIRRFASDICHNVRYNVN